MSVAAGCAPSGVVTPMPIDLLRELPRAALGPEGEADRLISVAFVERNGGPRPTLVMRGFSRVIWQVQMAEPAMLVADIARLAEGGPLGEAVVRIGISDDRVYEDHFHEALDPPVDGRPVWRPLAIDLSRYSGRKWSLFYQPARRVWSLVLNVRARDAVVALVEPTIGTRPSSARDRLSR